MPVISAVGHETDFTIADFVADLRAPTPSAAAELAVTDISELQDKLYLYKKRLQLLLKKRLEVMRLRYEKCMASRVFKEPDYKIKENYLQIDNLLKRMDTSINSKMKDYKMKMVEIVTMLDGISPLKTLARGYGILEKDSCVIKSVKDLRKDDIIDLRLTDGNAQAKVL